jgi:photosystem II stability/assembly factor-like uncharacterized protein
MKKSIATIFLIINSIIGFLSSNSIIKENHKVKCFIHVSGALNALEFWNTARAYPNEEISPDAFLDAFNKLQEIRLNKLQNISASQWKTIGPHNTGGRTNALAFNPQNANTIYAGSASGGLWKSYTGGIGIDAWHYVSTGFPVLGVSSIEIAPNDSNTIYIGTGEVYNCDGAGHGSAYRKLRGTYGIGILKSTDSGQSWFKSLDWSYSSQKGVWAVKINPLNPNTVFANTTEGVYRSYDAGISWQQVNNIIMGMDLVINPVDTNIIFSSHGNFASTGYGIYRSSDGGNTWNKITTGLPPSYQGKILLDIYKADPNIVYASIGHGFLTGYGASWLCKSTDSGLTWTILNQTDYSQHQGWYSHDVAIDQFNVNNVIVVGIAVWKSTDGGSTIIQKSDGAVNLGKPPIGGPDGGPGYTHCDVHIAIQHPTQQNIFYFGTDGGVFRTTDLGETYEACNGRYQTTQFYNGTSSSTLDSLKTMGGLQDNSTVIYDGDLAWMRVIGRDGSWTSIDPANDNNMYASWQSLNMFSSTDGGANFSDITPPSSIKTSFIAPFKSFIGNHSIIYAGRDKIFKSTDSGSSWTATNNNTSLDGNSAIAMEISYQNSEKVYIATSPYGTARGNIFRTTNGGTNWTNITGNLPDRYISDIVVNPFDDKIVYITFYGFGSGHVFKSTDSGDSWVDKSDNLPDIPTPSVIVDPNNTNHVYVGTDIGVFVSTTGGGSWQDFNGGLPDAVQVMDLNYTTVNNIIRVMTHGNGAYERKLLSQSITSTFQPWSNQVNVEDASGTESSKILTIGQAQNATDSLDLSLGEYELPPPPPISIFDARLNLPTSPMVSSLKDYRDSSKTEITWTMTFQPGSAGYPMTFNWDSTSFPEGTFYLKDRINGSFVNTNMKMRSNYILTNPDITSLNIIFDKGGINPTTPSAPTNLIAIANNYSVTLNWIDNSNNETGFVIERKDGDSLNVNPYMRIDTVLTNVTSFTNAGLTPNTTYTYRVFAFNDFYMSDYSDLAQTTTPDISETFQLTVSLLAGWNIVSIPGLHPVNQDLTTWWSGKDPTTSVYKFNGGYQTIIAAELRTGYWMKNLSNQTYNTGDEWPASGILVVSHDALNANAGWNLIGGYEDIVPAAGLTTTPSGLISGPVYGYLGGYYTPFNLEPGYGYWIKLTAAGQINIPDTLAQRTGEQVEWFQENWGKIILTDAAGINYTLYAIKGEVNLSQYELPPVPPAGIFDIRFSSGRIAEDINSSMQTIDMNGITYPLTVRVEGMDIRLQDETGKVLNQNLKSGEDIVISNATIQKLMVTGEMIPAEYALEQNYPNPFNPSTMIEFSLPENVGNVKLSIYNALGEKVAELVNTALVAGKYSYQWNAKNVATGMYIYELRTDKFVSVKKMILTK